STPSPKPPTPPSPHSPPSDPDAAMSESRPLEEPPRRPGHLPIRCQRTEEATDLLACREGHPPHSVARGARIKPCLNGSPRHCRGRAGVGAARNTWSRYLGREGLGNRALDDVAGSRRC